MNIRFAKSFTERFAGTSPGVNTYCYRIMSLLEQNIDDQEKVSARKEDRRPRECNIKTEYINTGRNADLERFLRSVNITLENFSAVAEHKVGFTKWQRQDIARELGVAEDAIWY